MDFKKDFKDTKSKFTYIIKLLGYLPTNIINDYEAKGWKEDDERGIALKFSDGTILKLEVGPSSLDDRLNLFLDFILEDVIQEVKDVAMIQGTIVKK